MPVRLELLETVARPPGHRQPDTVDITRRRIVRVFGRRHAEFGGGNEQGAHIRPAKAATGGAWHRHRQRLQQDPIAVVLQQAASVDKPTGYPRYPAPGRPVGPVLPASWRTPITFVERCRSLNKERGRESALPSLRTTTRRPYLSMPVRWAG